MDPGFQLLGPLTLTTGGRSVELGRSKHIALLAVLLLSPGRPVSAEVLLDRVWDGGSPTKSTFHAEIHKIRNLLQRHRVGAGKKALRHVAGSYTLHVAENAVDWHLFRRRVEKATAFAERGADERAFALLDEALAMWHGEPLAGLENPSLRNIRVTMNGEHRQAAKHRAEIGLRLGREAHLLTDLFNLTAQYPYDEPLVRHLMVALHRCGRTKEALNIGRQFARRLRAEGMPLPEESKRLQERILRADPSLLAPASPSGRGEASVPPGAGPGKSGDGDTVQPHLVRTQPSPPPRLPSGLFALPRDTPEFVGRMEQLERIVAGAGQPATISRVWTISGMTGIGKTALAVRAAHRLRRRFLDGQLFVGLHANSPSELPREPTEVLHELLREIGVSAEEIPGSPEGRAALWRGRTARTRILLVLDDAESADQVRPLLPEGPRCLVLVTSRHRLTSLEGAQQVSLAPLPPSEAVRLFRLRAGETGEEEAKDVDDVARRCGYHPLALRMMASRLRERSSWSVSDVVSLLRDSPDPIAEIRDEEGDLASILSASLRTLSADERDAFLRLGLHAGIDFGVSAAAALLDRPVADADRLLERLLRLHLLQEPGNGRYRFHDLLGDYARREAERFLPLEGRRAAIRRLLDCYLLRAEHADRLLHPHRRRLPVETGNRHQTAVVKTKSQAQELLRAERERFVQATRLARKYGFPRYVGQISHLLCDFLDSEGAWDSASWLHAQAVEIWEEANEPRWRAQALVELSRIWRQRTLLDAAWQTARSALEAWESLGDPRGIADALNQVGGAQILMARYTGALAAHEEAYAVYQELGDSHGMAVALVNGNLSRIRLGRYQETLTASDEALSLFQTAGNKVGEAAARNNRAEVLLIMERYREAELIYEDLLCLLLSVDRKREAGHILNNLAEVALRRNNPEHATELCERALRLYEETGELNDWPNVLRNIAEAALVSGDVERARSLYEESLRLVTASTVAVNGQAHLLIALGLGEAHYATGDHHSAGTYFERVRRLANERGMIAEEARALELIGEVALRRDGTLAARGHWERSLALYSQIGHPGRESVRARLYAARHEDR